MSSRAVSPVHATLLALLALLCLTVPPALAGDENAGDEAAEAAKPAPLPAAELRARLDAYLQPFVAAGHLSGNLLVARGDEVIYERSFGKADYELDVASTPETRFNVASITKPMTLVVLVKLLEAEKLGLADPLSKYVPDFPRGDEITVEHLARHRAGIPHRVTEESDQTVPHTAADMVAFAAQKELTLEPGSESSYSSGGYSVLARVLEIAGGAPYEDLVQQYVFAPAGMTHSIHTDSRHLLPGRAPSYKFNPRGDLENSPLEDLSYLVGAGSVYSTARDLHAMLRAARTGVYGEGAQQSLVDENGIDWNGITGGYRAFADWHRDSDTSIVFTANLHTGAGDLMRRDLPRIVAGEEVPAPTLPQVKPVEVADEVLRSYEGVYQMRPGSDLRVRATDGGLLVNAWTLVPTGPGVFYSPQDYAEVAVVMGDDGRPTRLDWKRAGEEALAFPRTGDL